MTLAQGLAFSIIGLMMALFAWGRWRYDLVAAIALLTAVIAGIVPPDQAFKGFSDDIVIIVGSALVVSAAVARSGVIERVARRLGPYLTTINRQIVALVGSVTALSAFVKNVGALAMLMPVAFQLARRSGTSPSSLLDAHVFRRASRRHCHVGGHLAECHRIAGARAVDRRTFQNVRFHPRRDRHRRRRFRLSCLRLAAAFPTAKAQPR